MPHANRSAAGDQDIWQRIDSWGVVPVVTLQDGRTARRLAEALTAGGLPGAEVTLRRAGATAAIEALAKVSEFLVGAGTVHSVRQAEQAVAAGARFVVTPGFAQDVVAWCLERSVPVLPGTATPTDLELALAHGLERVKFFPAEPLGGVPMLQALSGPYAAIRFMPTGGIDSSNLPSYLELPSVFACGGSWMVRREWLEHEAWEQVVRATSQARHAVERARGGTN